MFSCFRSASISGMMLLSMFVCGAAAHAQPWTPPVFPKPSPAEQRIYAALDDATELEFIEVPLADVIEFLKDKHDIPIELDTPMLDAVGLGSDTPITRNLRGIPLRNALWLMLNDLDLTYVVSKDVLLVTTTDRLAKFEELRVYDISKLLGPGDFAEDVASILTAAVVATPGSYTDYVHTPQGRTVQREFHPTRSIKPYRNLLLVRDNPVGHEAIVRALSAIGQGLGLENATKVDAATPAPNKLNGGQQRGRKEKIGSK